MAFTCYQAHAYFYRSARAVSHCDDAPRNEGLGKASTVPPFSDWRPWAGRVESGHFWAEDLRSVRAALLAQDQPKVTMRSLCDWRALRLRVRDAPDCVVTQYPEDAELLQSWMQKLGLEYRGQRLAPVHQALEGQLQVLQECHRTKTRILRAWRAACAAAFTRPTCRARPPALVCKLAKCDPDRICHGVDVARSRKNALANATFPLPVFSPAGLWSALGTGTWRTSPTWSCTGTTGRPCSGSSPTWAGWYSKPAAAYLLERARRPGPTSSGP